MGALGWVAGVFIGAVVIVFAAPLLLFPLVPVWITGGWRTVVEIVMSAGIMFASWRIGSMLI